MIIYLRASINDYIQVPQGIFMSLMGLENS